MKNKFESSRLTHAYLLSGQDVNSVKAFAKEFTKFINCLTRDVKQNSCGGCYSCAAIEKENYPDLLVVKSENSKSSIKNDEDKGEIDIEQIREVNNFLSIKPYYDSFKIVLIENAERMNTESQSCLLKTLEEPKGKTLIILISSNPEVLLPTIISRCQTVKFSSGANRFSEEENKIIREFAKIAGLSLAEKFAYAKATRLDSENFRKILNAARAHFRNILLEKIGVVGNRNAFNGDKVENFSVIKVKKILNLIEDISRKSLIYNVNLKLSLEILLIEI